MNITLEFKPFPKMARLRRECIITEKIDGTNASIYIGPAIYKDPNMVDEIYNSEGDAIGLWVGSRTRWVTPKDDNFGFAKWVYDHSFDLVKLGEGHHFGEWWGSGIQRGYGFKNGERFFSLFNASHWVEHDQPVRLIEQDNPKAEPKFTQHAPACCKVVPILHDGIFDTDIALSAMRRLEIYGSKAAAGYMNPEGIVVYHKAAATGFKMTIKNDDKPKGQP